MRYSLMMATVAVLLSGGAGAAGPAPATQTIVLAGTGPSDLFEGIGVVDGGGATSVLLKDYPEPQRSELLDLLYKPQFGASVNALYVEIPGDGNSTQGAMPSHQHTRTDINYSRGYTWWVMREARARNPALSLDGTAWSAPGWIGDNGKLYAQNTGTHYSGDKAFFSEDTADYYVSWLTGLRDVYGLELDAIGMRNEKGASYELAKVLRAKLNAGGFDRVRLHAFDNWPDAWKFNFVQDMQGDPALRDAIDIIGAHINAPKSAVTPQVRAQAAAMGKPLWNTEQHVYEAGYDGLIGIVQAFNENYVRSGVTRVINWYGIGGVYEMQPYSGAKEAAVRANWPWSGHYAINPSLWGYAHYGQFAQIGWRYLRQGSGDLAGGGTMVTLASPRGDYSTIIETRAATAAQTVRLQVGAGLSTGPLAVWRSDRDAQFVRQADLQPQQGAVTLTLAPGAVYSLTTTRGQRKGGFAPAPARGAFPFPYREAFDQYGSPQQWGYLPRYFADVSGAFELAPCPARPGLCLRQSAPVPPISWGPDWRPYTIIGDDRWRDYEVDADVYLNRGDSAMVMGRINQVGTGYGVIPKGYFAELSDNGDVRLVVVRGKVDKRALVGDAEQQAIIKAQRDASPGGEKLLASTRLASVGPARWHQLRLRFVGPAITVWVDGVQVLAATDTQYEQGMAGLATAGPPGKLGMPFFDNLDLRAPGAPPTPAATAAPGQRALYDHAGAGSPAGHAAQTAQAGRPVQPGQAGSR